MNQIADDVFETHRSALLGLAYRMTGSRADAEDIVQDAYLRWRRADKTAVHKPRAFLSTTVTRLCLDALDSARSRREVYVGPWLPEPLIGDDGLGADRATELAQDVSIALMLALERLSPLERAAFILHDVFDCGYAELSSTLERSQDACRQLVSRARSRVAKARPGSVADRAECEGLVAAFREALVSGDLTALRDTLARDAVLYSDGGGRVVAALRPIQGRQRIVRFLVGIAKKFPMEDSTRIEATTVNGMAGLVFQDHDRILQTVGFEVRHGRVQAIFIVRNPDKLHGRPHEPTAH